MLAAGLVLCLSLALAALAYAARTRSVPEIIRQTFRGDEQRALCIAAYESTGRPGHFNPAAMNGQNTGLFQIARGTWDPTVNPRARAIVGNVVWSRMLEPAYNAAVARRIYLYEQRAGVNPWGPWSTRSLCGA